MVDAACSKGQLCEGTVPYMLVHDRLSSGSSFILCDANTQGFPIRYASQGFAELFGYSAVECLGQRCGVLVGGESVLADDPELAKMSAATDLTPSEVKAGFDVMRERAATELRRMMAYPLCEEVGYAVLLNRKKCGKLLTCELVMQCQRHPTLGWAYIVGMQHDITEEVPLQELLRKASSDAYHEIIASREASVKAKADQLRCSRTVQYLHGKAGEMWQALIADMVRVSEPEKRTKKEVHSIGSRSTASRESKGSSRSSSSCSSSMTWNSSQSLLRAALQRAEEEEKRRKEEETAAFLSKLKGMSKRELKKVALDIGIDEQEVNDANDEEDAREAITQLILAQKAPRTGGFHPGPFGGFGGRGYVDKSLVQEDGGAPDPIEEEDTSGDLADETSGEASGDHGTSGDQAEEEMSDQTGPTSESDEAPAVSLPKCKDIIDSVLPLFILDVSRRCCPFLVCSVGFCELTGCSLEEVVGLSLLKLLSPEQGEASLPPWAATRFREMVEYASQGRYVPASVAKSTHQAVLYEQDGCSTMVPRSLEGELVFVHKFTTESGDTSERLLMLKQVELDDVMFILGILSRPSMEDCEDDPESTMKYDIDTAQNVLAKNFWFCAPMRRSL